jgi:NADH-quinone oxidoreductase subunit E
MITEARVKPEPNFALIDAITHKHNVQPGAVIPVLQEVQEVFGYVPPAAIQRISENMGVAASEISGIVTFYAQFRLRPLGKNVVKVCHGTACHLGGAEQVSDSLCQCVGAKEGETSPDGQFTVERVACLGCCSLAPCVMLNGEVHGRLTPDTVAKVVREVQESEKVTLE